ncbi:MAG: ABC transporter substrate-binding protein [Rhodoplanes sp.]
MNRRNCLVLAATALIAVGAGPALAQDTVKIGVTLGLTGPLQIIGTEALAGMRLYMAEHGDTVAGKKIELIVRDDGAVAENAKRIAQELIVRDKVNILAGFTVTPTALAVAPLATEAKIPMVVVNAGTSIITERSPYIVRTSFTLPQSSAVIAEWALKNGLKKVVSVVSDYGPGIDAETSFKEAFTKGGGEVIEAVRAPLASPDFAPFLQRARDANPQAVFVFVPSGQAATFVKQFIERGIEKSGIKLIGPGDVTDDAQLNGMGDQIIGTVTAHLYSTYHPSAMNKKFVAAFEKANPGLRPNFTAVSGYDGMHLIYEALKKTGGDTNGDKLIAAMKGMAWESPRGPISIDPETRDIIQNIYIRRVEKKDGELYNVEFDTFEAVKDPVKAKKKGS